MKKSLKHIIFTTLLIVLISCVGSKSIRKTIFVGNFKEYKYDFFETFTHNTDKDFYANLPFELKFGGIRPFPFDTIGEKDYSWIRKSENLILAFNTAKAIGLDNFISAEQYNKTNSIWSSDTQWDNKTINEIVKGYINSDTSSNLNDYYSKFWERRRKEKNLKETYDIFVQIDDFYNKTKHNRQTEQIDSILYNLWHFDMLMTHSDTMQYKDIVVKYFDYLKKVKLEYSAYKLIFNNNRLRISSKVKDSLLLTLNCDTINEVQWEKMDDNRGGWITWENYQDPKRYYGP